MALIRSREALVSRRTQLVNPGYEGRSNPSELACPSVRPGASTRTERLSTSPRHSSQPWSPSWSRGRLPHTAHPSIRPKAGGDLPRALPTNGSVEAGRGDRGAHGAYLRADLGEPLPLCKEPLGRSVPGVRSSHTALRREGPPKTHLQGGRPDVKEAFGRLRLYYVLGPFGSDSDLRRHGQKIAARGAKNAKKRAVVAVARKLCVLLHRLWVSGEIYDPLYNAHLSQGQEEAA
jgi:hypothetical protein